MAIEIIGSTVLAGLTQKAILARRFKVIRNREKNGKRGQTVDINIDPLVDVTVKTYTAANKAAQEDYDYDALNLETVPVTLTDEVYAAVEVDGWDKLQVEMETSADFAGLISALVQKLVNNIESAAAAVINAVTNNAVTVEVPTGATLSQEGEALVDQINQLSFDLDDKGVQSDGRTLYVGRGIARRLLANKDILNVSKSDSDGALRAAIIGEIAGFEVVKSSRIGDQVMVAAGPDAFVLVSRAPGKISTAMESELVTTVDAETGEEGLVDIRANVLGLGKRVADGVSVHTFFKAAGPDAANRAKKVTITFDEAAA